MIADRVVASLVNKEQNVETSESHTETQPNVQVNLMAEKENKDHKVDVSWVIKSYLNR